MYNDVARLGADTPDEQLEESACCVVCSALAQLIWRSSHHIMSDNIHVAQRLACDG